MLRRIMYFICTLAYITIKSLYNAALGVEIFLKTNMYLLCTYIQILKMKAKYSGNFYQFERNIP